MRNATLSLIEGVTNANHDKKNIGATIRRIIIRKSHIPYPLPIKPVAKRQQQQQHIYHQYVFIIRYVSHTL